MSIESVIERVRLRMEQDPRGDRGWFIITRVHVDAYWLKGIADYLFQKGGVEPISLTSLDYNNIAKIAGVASPNPGQQLRRHHLLVMDKPLGLIQRTQPPSWDEIKLSWFGRKLATTTYFSPVLDKALQSIRFAQGDNIPPSRAAAYAQFDVWVYDAIVIILQACEGRIDRDEFNFFVSRVRLEHEVPWAIQGIRDYRQTMANLDEAGQENLLQTLNGFVHAGLDRKEYGNWRDIALHTFSLFDIGETMVRHGRELWLTSAWVGEDRFQTGAADDRNEANLTEVPAEKERRVREDAPAYRERRALKIPVPPRDDELLSPPVAPPQANSGVEGENLIAKILTSQGWRVVFYTNKRGYGFDLWASKDDLAMVIEVKSGTGPVGQITLTPTEYEAARHHGANYVLAVVENAHSQEPQVWFVTDPASKIKFRKAEDISYQVAREAWTGVAQQVF